MKDLTLLPVYIYDLCYFFVIIFKNMIMKDLTPLPDPYAFMSGFANAAFSAVVLHAIGEGLAATKYALLSSISNIAPVYMVLIDGWLHDKYNIKTMLLGESFLGVCFVVIALFSLWQFNAKNKLGTKNSIYR